MIAFAFPLSRLHWWLGLALLVLAAVILALRALEKRRKARLDLFVESPLADRLLVGYESRFRRPLAWLFVLGLVFWGLALAQPRWGQSWQEVEQYSRDVIVCLDTSESMRAANPLPNRLERAKQKILALVDRSPGERYGLVAFSGAAASQCPLTVDRGYFKAVLAAVDTDTVSMEGTDIAAAIREAVKVFQEADESAGYSQGARCILVISDGEAVSGDAIEAAEEASEIARVFVIGVGDPRGAEIELPEWMGQYARPGASGMKHLSKLDEETLMRVATAGNGAYTRARVDNWDVEQIADRLDALAARHVTSDVRLHMVNRYQWPLAVAVACFAAEGLWLVLLPWMRRWRMRAPVARKPEGGPANAA